MVTVLRQLESAPIAYPSAVPSGLSTAAAALSTGLIWSRIESYIAFRYSPRAVLWTVEGCGEFVPPLAPVTFDDPNGIMVWSCGAETWEIATLNASPLGGFWLPHSGPWRFSASVGTPVDQTPPDAVMEAYRRLAEYFAADPGKAGATRELVYLGEALRQETERNPAHMAKALQNSGAADLLRPYRRVI